MAQDYSNQVELTFNDNRWHLVQPFEDKTLALTVKNKSNTSVSVFCTANTSLTINNLDTYLSSNGIDPIEIGGVFYEVSSKVNERMFIKCNEGTGKVAVRIYGTMDPSEDITILAEFINETKLILDEHVNTKSGNPHRVTKSDVGLGNIPNSLTSNVNDTKYDTVADSNVLVTLKGLRQVRDYAKAHIDTVTGNPHNVTKEEVGLGNVANYPIATAKQALDITNNQVYMTPYTTNELIKDIVVVADSMMPQCVIAGQVSNRPQGWSINDCIAPSMIITKTGSSSVLIKAGLQVSFAYRQMCRISKVLEEDMSCVIGGVIPNGTRYLFVDLDEKGNITGWGHTDKTPSTLPRADAVAGDYYNYSQCEMRSVTGEELKRVYIGKLYYNNNEIIEIVPVPIGDTTIIPVTVSIPLGKSAIINNPYIAPVNTKLLVEYDGKWGETGWNDQTGVLAHPRPGFEIDQIAIQVGAVGYITRGSSSGNGFGAEFVTIDTPLRMAMEISRPH